MILCTVPECGRKLHAGGLCTAHRERIRRWGDVRADLPIGTKPVSDERRFWSYVDKSAGPTACWVWTGGLTPDGYGRLNVSRRLERAHRLAWLYLVGPVTKGMVLDHTCHNADRSCAGGSSCVHRRCVNPAHLEMVTNRVNARRGAKGRIESCTHGHDYDEANTYYDRLGHRACRTCHRLRERIARRWAA